MILLWQTDLIQAFLGFEIPDVCPDLLHHLLLGSCKQGMKVRVSIESFSLLVSLAPLRMLSARSSWLAAMKSGQ